MGTKTGLRDAALHPEFWASISGVNTLPVWDKKTELSDKSLGILNGVRRYKSLGILNDQRPSNHWTRATTNIYKKKQTNKNKNDVPRVLSIAQECWPSKSLNSYSKIFLSLMGSVFVFQIWRSRWTSCSQSKADVRRAARPSWPRAEHPLAGEDVHSRSSLGRLE